MKSRDYWLQREKEAHDNAIRTEERYKRELMKYCDLMQDSIEKEINAFYGKYAAKEGLSIADAKKRADKLDIEAYAKKAKEYVDTHDLSDQANEEMRLYNLTMKVNRLELLKANIGLEMIKNFEDLTNALEDDMTEEARETYERLAGILGNSIHGNEKQIKSLVNASFKGAKFSENIWGYGAALKGQLATKITQGLIQGKSAQELARSLRKDFDTTRYEAERLMRTELTRVRVQAQLDSYEQAGFEEYEFVNFSSAGFAGGPICPVCTKKNGEHFPIRDFMPGTNAPPMHPNCRCSTVPYVGEEGADSSIKNNSVDKKLQKRYSNSPAKSQKDIDLEKAYTKSVSDGWISPLCGVDNYIKAYHRIEDEILGKITVAGIQLKSISFHFMERVFGTAVDPKIFREQHRKISRSGVEVDDIIEALFEGKARDPIANPETGELSQQHYTSKCSVSVNPKTGTLIQVNPISRKKKRHE